MARRKGLTAGETGKTDALASALDLCVERAGEIQRLIGGTLDQIEQEKKEFLEHLNRQISLIEERLGPFLSVQEKRRVEEICTFPWYSASVRNERRIFESLSEDTFHSAQELSEISGVSTPTVYTIMTRFMNADPKAVESRQRKPRGRGKSAPEYRRLPQAKLPKSDETKSE